MTVNFIHGPDTNRFSGARPDGLLASLSLDRLEVDDGAEAVAGCVVAMDLGHTRLELRLSEQRRVATLALAPEGKGCREQRETGLFAVSLEGALAEQLRGALQSSRGAVIVLPRPAASDAIGTLVSTLRGEGQDESVRDLYAHSLALMIAARAISAGRPGDAAPKRSVSPLPKWRLRRVDAFLDDHLGRCVALADLARAAGLSPMYFAAQFRAARGVSPHEYLLSRRIERAQERMIASTDRLIEIALEVGFQSQAHFTTVFKRLTGTTPHRWRETVRRDRRAA